MGNCQAAADAAAAVIQHADGRLETVYWPLSASQVMAANPGHYIAAIINVARPRSGGSGGPKQVRYLKLLQPEDALLGGQFYRLVSFEDVLRENGSKRRVRLSKLLPKRKDELKKKRGEADSSSSVSFLMDHEEDEIAEEEHGFGNVFEANSVQRIARNGQWRPTLQTISEAGSFKLPPTLTIRSCLKSEAVIMQS